MGSTQVPFPNLKKTYVILLFSNIWNIPIQIVKIYGYMTNSKIEVIFMFQKSQIQMFPIYILTSLLRVELWTRINTAWFEIKNSHLNNNFCHI